MKINILFPFKSGPWGGANQFLKAIKEFFVIHKIYEEDPRLADIIILNSSPMSIIYTIDEVYRIKRKYPDKIVINRMDGPVYHIRGRNAEIDKVFYLVSKYVCNGVIFQSKWSKDKNHSLGLDLEGNYTTIINAPDPKYFSFERSEINSKSNRIRIIATSWSSNISKGFDVYKWMDENLDFDRYEFVFIGNSPFKFKNIIVKEAMNSLQLSEELKNSDIFITASRNDPCSNSLIEALHCGLPSIAYNDGGHGEIIGKGGRVFNNTEELLLCLDDVSNNYDYYKENIDFNDLEGTGWLYFNFIMNIVKNESGKNFTFYKYCIIKMAIFHWRFKEKLFSLQSMLRKLIEGSK